MMRLRLYLIPTLICLPVFTFLLSLGNWQMERLTWKKSLIEVIEARLAAPLQNIPESGEWKNLSSDDYVYQPVFLKGVFDHQAEQFWFVHHEKFGPGYQVITPFVIGGERIVMVNRGYIPASQQAPVTRQDGQISGEVRLEGLMVWPGERNIFEPPNEPDNNLWFVKDINAMAKNAGYEDNSWLIAPFFVDSLETPENVYPVQAPIGGQTRVNLPNRHLEYVVTWYGLALALVIVYVQWLIKQTNRAKSENETE
ncbi:MAG: SURF1 family protein [PS1 clade bacterium]|uniref:SURF1-like protein n=1 Tax=PS1 clade bacterium TaxID=2175152 RepID=A0A368E1K6_9PROT|nr:MAG: SURF1 family protein [PS1 clade bacterium]